MAVIDEFYVPLLTQRFREARTKVELMLQALFSERAGNERIATIQGARESLEALRDVLPSEEYPAWLAGIIQNCDLMARKPGGSDNIRAAILITTELWPAMKTHTWRLDEEHGVAFDFDAIFTRYRDENRVPELFDRLIAALEEIIESGAIDSLKARKELDRLVATLRKSKNGSYLATRSAWDFMISWMQNTGWKLFDEIPVLRAFVAGLRETINDGNEAIERTNEQMHIALSQEVQVDMPYIEYRKPEVQLLPPPEQS